MTKQQSPLRQSFNILNSFLLSVFVIFLVDITIARSYFYEFFVASPLGAPILIIFILLNIYFYSGICGSLVELASGEEMVLTFSKFKQNVRKFWKIWFLLTFLPYCVHFFLFILFRDEKISIKAVEVYLNIMVLYLLAGWIINKKYLQPFHLPQKHIKVNIHAMGVITVLYIANLFLFCLPQWVETGDFDLARTTLFLSKYVHLFTFLYLTVLVLRQYPEIEGKFNKKKELFLVNPLGGGLMPSIVFLLIWRSRSLLFVVLKAFTPKYYKIREFNKVIWQDRYYQKNKLVAITCYSSNSLEAYKIAKEFKKRGSRVIMGGPHVTYLPEEALEYADSVVIGEAEGVWRDVIKDYENDSLKKTYFGTATEEDYKEVHQELLNSPPEMIKEYLETTHGCKYHCDFCAVPVLSGGKVRTKPVGEIVELIKKIRHKYRKINFIDNNIYAAPGYAKELFKSLKPLDIKWSGQCTIDIAKDDEALQLAKESGCWLLGFGYEILENSPEREKGGKYAMAGRYKQLTRKVKEKGIAVHAKMIFGFDSDTFRTIFDLWKFCFSVKSYQGGMALLTPLPGTKFYHDMLRQNRLTNLNWRYYTSYSLVFRHGKMNNYLLAWVYPAASFFFSTTSSMRGCFFLGSLILSYVLFQWAHMISFR